MSRTDFLHPPLRRSPAAVVAPPKAVLEHRCELFASTQRRVSTIEELFTAGAGLVVIHGCPGSGRTHLAKTWLQRRVDDRDDLSSLGWLDGAAEAEDLARAVRAFSSTTDASVRLVIDDVDPSALPVLAALVTSDAGIEILVTCLHPPSEESPSICCNDWNVEELAAALRLRGLSENFEALLPRAGVLPATLDAIERARALTKEETLLAWSKLEPRERPGHPLTSSLTRAKAFAPLWQACPDRLQQAWMALALYAGGFDLEESLELLAGHADPMAALEELSQWGIVTRSQAMHGSKPLEMRPGARVFAHEVLAENPRFEEPLCAARAAHLAQCLARATELQHVLEFGFKNAVPEHTAARWRDDFSLAQGTVEQDLRRDLSGEKLANLLTLVTARALILFGERNHGGAIEALKGHIPDDEVLVEADRNVALATCAALRALSKILAAAGFLDGAREALLRARRIAEVRRDSLAMARCAYEEAVIARAAGDGPLAREAVARGRTIAESDLLLDEVARLTELEAIVLHTFEDHRAAEPVHRKALTLARQANLTGLEAYILVHLGNVYWRDGDLVRARACLISAEARQIELGDERARATTLTGLGTVALDLGSTDEAHDYAAKASGLHRESGQVLPDGMTLVLRGRVCLDEEDAAGAERFLLEALTAIPRSTSSQWQQKLDLLEAQVALMRRDHPRADAVAAQSLEEPRQPGPIRIEMLLVRMLCALLQGDQSGAEAYGADLASVDPGHDVHARAMVHLVSLLKFVFSTEALQDEQTSKDAQAACIDLFSPGPGKAHLRISSRLRFWFALIDGFLPRDMRNRLWARALGAAEETWAIAGFEVWPPGTSTSIDLQRRLVPATIFKALVEARARDMDEPGLTDDELIAIGWPGERILADSAMARLQKTISDLRKLGPGVLIERTATGYWIPHHHRIAFVPETFHQWWIGERSRLPS